MLLLMGWFFKPRWRLIWLEIFATLAQLTPAAGRVKPVHLSASTSQTTVTPAIKRARGKSMRRCCVLSAALSNSDQPHEAQMNTPTPAQPVPAPFVDLHAESYNARNDAQALTLQIKSLPEQWL